MSGDLPRHGHLRAGHARRGQRGLGDAANLLADAIGRVAQLQRQRGSAAAQLNVTIFYRNTQIQTSIRVLRGAQRGADVFYRYTHVTMVP
ncbi:hypothetical protein D3C87_1756080 [compost metagenome]